MGGFVKVGVKEVGKWGKCYGNVTVLVLTVNNRKIEMW
jgi:hypothetical protein